MSQAKFAARFGLTNGAVKDLEQSRTRPTRLMVLMTVTAIEMDAGFMTKVAEPASPISTP